MITLKIKKIVLVSFVLCLSLIHTSTASELVHKFGNPSFSKEGYSQHALSIEQLQYTRENDRMKDVKSALSQAERDEKNKTINKFIANVESRIYANLSKQLVDNMFGESLKNYELYLCINIFGRDVPVWLLNNNGEFC